LVRKFAAALGMGWRLEAAVTLPAWDEPSREWPVARAKLGELSNWMPATLKTLEIALHHAGEGEKVLIGSDLLATGKFLADELERKGVKAVHVTEEKAGKTATKTLRKCAREVRAFAEGEAQVLCCGLQAVKLGHNLASASVVIINGLDWSHMILVQFLDRVHRLTSQKPVNVYIVIPKGTIAERKWALLKDKDGAADMWTLFTLPTRYALQASTALVLEVYTSPLRPSTPRSSSRHDQRIISSN
jgi:SNF2 family DNA or RNA helicase